MILDFLFVVIGLAVLLTGARFVVHSALLIATSFGLNRVLVGSTIVAFGTSAPELVISMTASLGDSDGLGIGNVIGSNVANVALVLGMAAVLSPMVVDRRLLHWEIPVLLAATVAVLLAGMDGELARWEGLVLFAVGLGGFVIASLLLVPESPALVTDRHKSSAEYSPGLDKMLTNGFLLIVGLVCLAVGAAVVVQGATGIAEQIGFSDLAIGVTVVAIGTSLPEIATTVIAALRREHDIAIASAVGSNIFNLLGVLGLTALVAPLNFDQSLYQFEMIALGLSSLVLFPIVALHTKSLVDRREGMLLLVSYVVFLGLILERA